jgi:hypothetical protein
MPKTQISPFRFLRKNSALLFFLFTSFFCCNLVHSQQQDDAICLSGGTHEFDYRKKPWKGYNQFLYNHLLKIGYYGEKDKTRYLVPIQFWAYRKSDGTGGASLAEIKTFMDDLNMFNSQNHTGIKFYIRDIEFINKTSRMVFGYYLEAPFQTILRHTKPAINVFLVESFKKKQEAKKMVRGTYNIFTKSIIIQHDNSSTSLTHEVGHYFGLLHPHRNYNMGKKHQEPVSRERVNHKGIPICQLNGDLLSDTPAEPKLTFLVDNDCNFIGTALQDNWGDNYQSSVDNIMSYPTHYECRNAFTLGQIGIMLYSASINKYEEFWNTDNQENHKYFFDENEPDDYQEMAGVIKPGIEQAHNFHKIFLKKGKDAIDPCDWVKFEVKKEDKRNIKITITPDKGNDQTIAASLLDKNKISLASKNAASPNESISLGFQNVVSDWYYIYISSSNTKNLEKVDKYTVKVELY